MLRKLSSVSEQAPPLTGIVTGGASGIGLACVRKLASLGHNVVIADFSFDRASEVASEIGANAFAIKTDVSSDDDCRRMVDDTVERFGNLNFAVNNAGTGNIDKSLTADIGFSEWRRLMSINLDGLFLCLSHELKAMETQGTEGSIVNIASVMGNVATVGAAAYVASKHAVVGLSKAAALDYAAKGIRVNAVGPGYVETPMLGNRSADELDEISARHPLGRVAKPDEIAELVAFLALPSSSFITGSYYPIDGGYLAR